MREGLEQQLAPRALGGLGSPQTLAWDGLVDDPSGGFALQRVGERLVRVGRQAPVLRGTCVRAKDLPPIPGGEVEESMAPLSEFM